MIKQGTVAKRKQTRTCLVLRAFGLKKDPIRNNPANKGLELREQGKVATDKRKKLPCSY